MRYSHDEVTIDGRSVSMLYRHNKTIKDLSIPPYHRPGILEPQRGRDLKASVFVFLLKSDKTERKEINDFFRECHTYSKRNGKGIMNGVISIPVIFLEQIDREVIEFVMKPPRKHISSFEFPLIFDLSRGRFFCYKDNDMWGRKVYPFIRREVERIFG